MNAKYFSFSPQYQFFPPKREHKIPISIYPHLRENSKINYYNKHMVTLGMKSLKILSFGQKKKKMEEMRIVYHKPSQLSNPPGPCYRSRYMK